MTDVVGSASFELRATREKMKQDLKAAETDLKGFTSKAESDIGGSSGRIGGSIGRMAGLATTAITGLVTVLGLAAAAALNLGVAGQKMADDIANSAARINVSTTALQEWRFVATKSGEDAKAADQALAGFAKRLGDASSGLSGDSIKVFEALGFTQQDLRQFTDVEAALDAVIDRIDELGSASDKTAVIERLGLSPLSAALRGGADDVAALRDEARALGIVMDEDMIQRASKAQGEFDTLSQVIDVNLKSAFIDLAPAINAAIGLVARLARALSDAMDSFRDLESKNDRGLAQRSDNLQRRVSSARNMARRQPGGRLTAVQQGWVDELAEVNNEIGQRARDRIASRQSSPQAGGGRELLTERDTGTRSPRRTAERTARVVDLAAIRAELELRNAVDLARASGDDAAIRAAEEKLDLARLTAAFERAGYEDAEFRAATQVAAMNQALARAEEKEATDKRALEIAEEEVEARERAAELLDMQLSDQIELARLSGDEGLLKSLLREEEIRRRIVDLMRLTPGLTEDAARSQATATTDDRDAANRVGKMREEFRSAFTDGIRAAIDGDLGSFFESLADRFTDRMLDNLADDLFDLLSSAMKGTGGQGGGFLSAVGSFFASTFGGGRAAGGPMTGGSWYRVGEHGPENIVMPRDGFAIPNGAMAGAGQDRAQRIVVEVGVNDDRFNASMREVASPIATQAGRAAFTGARQQVPADQARVSRFSLAGR
jgi:hypothetical protein